jgi:hypothetical protein
MMGLWNATSITKMGQEYIMIAALCDLAFEVNLIK